MGFAERLHGAIASPFDIEGQQFRLGISIGIAIPPSHGRTVGELLRYVDPALYQAKSAGRSRSVVFEQEMAADQLEHYLLERDLDEAVERNQPPPITYSSGILQRSSASNALAAASDEAGFCPVTSKPSVTA